MCAVIRPSDGVAAGLLFLLVCFMLLVNILLHNCGCNMFLCLSSLFGQSVCKRHAIFSTLTEVAWSWLQLSIRHGLTALLLLYSALPHKSFKEAPPAMHQCSCWTLLGRLPQTQMSPPLMQQW